MSFPIANIVLRLSEPVNGSARPSMANTPSAITSGVDPTKGLILQLDRGGVRMFDAAHTTVAKQ